MCCIVVGNSIGDVVYVTCESMFLFYSGTLFISGTLQVIDLRTFLD